MRKARHITLIAICFAILIALTGIALTKDAEDTLPWWQQRVFYEIFVRSFYDSDGDGIGDLQGVIAKLDYLADLGVGGIWLMPIMPSPTYHGYDVTDYYAINPDYGTLDDFRELMAEARARDIAIIIDLVLNHTSNRHPWFIEAQIPGSAYDDWYVWSETDPGFRGAERQPVWHRSGDRFYYGQFWSGMPDLNYRNPAVTEAMYNVTRFWLEEMGVDGFRLDAIKYLVEDGRALEHTAETYQWLREYQAFVKSINPDALLLGEVWSSTTLASTYVPDQMDLVFEFDLAQAMVRAASFGLTNTVLTVLNEVEAAYPNDQYATFLTNHDQNRVMSQLRGNIGAAKTAAALLLTLPGVPFVYYGEEIGMVGVKPDEQIRTPMQWDSTPVTAGFTTGRPWQAINPDYTTVNVAQQQTDPDALLSHYRRLMRARASSPALQYGSLTLVENNARGLLSFLRQTDTQTALILLNMEDRPITTYALTLPDTLSFSGAAMLVGEGIPAIPIPSAPYQPIPELTPQSVIIIELIL